MGDELEWDRLDHAQASRISLYFPDVIRVMDEDRWPEARQWLIDALGRIRVSFDPVLGELEWEEISEPLFSSREE